MSTGISWPVDPKTGKASSTPVNKGVWIAALSALSDPAAKDLAARIEGERRWRQKYVGLVHEVVVLQAAATREECLSSCKVRKEKLG